MREDIPTTILPTESVPSSGLYDEISLGNSKWLLNQSCNLENIIERHLAALGECLNLYYPNYVKVFNNLILGDFNNSVKKTL